MISAPVLTRRQNEIYDFIQDCIATRQRPPTVRQIGQQFQIRSPNGVMCHLKALEKKGLIEREEHVSNGIRVRNSAVPDWRRKPTIPGSYVVQPDGGKEYLKFLAPGDIEMLETQNFRGWVYGPIPSRTV